jgi:DNA-binding NarL/FixJ family response regulator
MPQSNHGPHPTPLRILIVDNHFVVRAGLTSVLGPEADLAVVGEAVYGQAAITQVKQLRPNGVLRDVRLPVLDGIESTRQIHAHSSAIRIIRTSIGADPKVVAAMRETGATGFVDKVEGVDTILATIRQEQDVGHAPCG